MSFKSDKQPLCRFCGGKIKKVTESHSLWQNHWQKRIDPTFVPETKVGYNNIETEINRSFEECVFPKTREEAQKLFNQPIISVRWCSDKSRGIEIVSTWDGETYEDEFFCNGNHAKMFAYAAARTNLAMPAYNVAIKENE